MNHTKEPWHVCDGLISSEKKEAIALVEHSGMNGPVSPTGSANARRIVACVNACADIPSDKLDGLATMARLGIELSDAINDPDGRFNRLEKEHYANEFALEKAGISGEACETKVSKGIELLTAQRDELLAALKDCIYTAENFGIPYAGRDARDRAKVIIKKYDHA